MDKDKTQEKRAVILTALPVEYKAVRAFLDDIKTEKHEQGTVYEVGRYKEVWSVALVHTGPGNVTAALEAERAIQHFKPELIMFVGIAGGVKDVAIGDVVVANKVYGYESGKETDAGFLPRPVVWQSTYPMVQLARYLTTKDHSVAGLRKFKAFLAPIAAGEKVVASTVSDLTKFLKSTYGDSLAVEMEGVGLLQAAHANPKVDAVVVRGISDLLGGKTEADASGSQSIASDSAATVAFSLLDHRSDERSIASEATPDRSIEKGAKDGASVRGNADRLLTQLANNEITVAEAALRFYTYFASSIGAAELKWLKSELMGYEQANDSEEPIYPSYRYPTGTLMGYHPRRGVDHISFSASSTKEEANVKELLTKRPIALSIGEIEEEANGSKETITMSLSAETEKQLVKAIHESMLKQHGKLIADMATAGLEPFLEYPKSAFVGIVTTVRTKLIELIKSLAEKPQQDIVTSNSSKPKIEPKPDLSKKENKTISSEKSSVEEETTSAALRRFDALPGLDSGLPITLIIQITGPVVKVPKNVCDAWGLTFGGSICRSIEVIVPSDVGDLGFLRELYADRNTAEWLYSAPTKTSFSAQVYLAFGLSTKVVDIPTFDNPMDGIALKMAGKPLAKQVKQSDHIQGIVLAATGEVFSLS